MEREQNQSNKAKVWAFWQALDSAGAGDVGAVCEAFLSSDFRWVGPVPIGTVTGPKALAEQVWSPLKAAIPDLTRQTHILCGGQSSAHADGRPDDTTWVAGTGYLTGRAVAGFLGIPATDTDLRIRWGEFIRFDGDEMVEAQVILDFVDWFDQIGLPVLPHPRGAAHVYPAPTGFDGVLHGEQDPTSTVRTLEFGRSFVFGGLNAFDENDLSSMGMAGYFHPNVKWYGPGGIGACLSFREFEELHQKPWLVAFPDRKVQGLESLFAEGRILAASGVAGVGATHTGPYLGHAATGNVLEVSGIDFWLRDGDQFTENWVFVDMPHLFGQMDVDLFARMRAAAADKGL